MEKDEQTPTLSLSKLVRRIKAQPPMEKLLFFSFVVMVGCSTLPWQRGHAGVGEHNAWQLAPQEFVAMLVPVSGLLFRLAALSGLLRRDAWAWLRWYRFAFLGLAAVLIVDLISLPMKGFGYWLFVMGFLIQVYSLQALLGARGLLPFRASR